MKTGKRSINNRIHGAMRALSEQARRGWDIDEIKILMKFMAIENGYEAKIYKRKSPDGKERYYKIPGSLRSATDAQAKILHDTIQLFADENGFWLYEYDDNENIYKSLCGRTKEEMGRYIQALKDSGKMEEAIDLETAKE